MGDPDRGIASLAAGTVEPALGLRLVAYRAVDNLQKAILAFRAGDWSGRVAEGGLQGLYPFGGRRHGFSLRTEGARF